MSANIGNVKDNWENCFYNTSAYLTANLTEFRNGPKNKKGKLQEMGCLETIGRRVIGEICYALLFIVAIVETVVRAVLFIPGIVLAMCLKPCSKSLADGIASFVMGFASSAPTILIALTALVQNVYSKKMDMNTIIPCLAEAPIKIVDCTSHCFCK